MITPGCSPREGAGRGAGYRRRGRAGGAHAGESIRRSYTRRAAAGTGRAAPPRHGRPGGRYHPGEGLVRRFRAAVVVVVVLAWASSRLGAAAVVQRHHQNLFVRDALDELYLWYRELPAVDPVRFDSPEAYLEAVRYRPLDTSFSYITSRAASDAFYSESQYIGFGLSTSMSGDEMRVLQVFADSPAAEAGLARGARITSIDGVSMAALVASGRRRLGVRPGHRRGRRRHPVRAARRPPRRGDDAQAPGHDSDRIAHPRVRGRRPQGRLSSSSATSSGRAWRRSTRRSRRCARPG